MGVAPYSGLCCAACSFSLVTHVDALPRPLCFYPPPPPSSHHRLLGEATLNRPLLKTRTLNPHFQDRSTLLLSLQALVNVSSSLTLLHETTLQTPTSSHLACTRRKRRNGKTEHLIGTTTRKMGKSSNFLEEEQEKEKWEKRAPFW